ncbi:MAG: UDP-N-acetylmuramoyl-tripeptide--D-alanyl-D-alanine ligase [Tissierellales bacterium]|nr:UDP-N-acetylmuramoyl-tripeptide--D-alanyl-D-alanine ligase [Tissierellales bacterium]
MINVLEKYYYIAMFGIILIWMYPQFKRLTYFFHMLQLNEYDQGNYINWNKEHFSTKVFTIREAILALLFSLLIFVGIKMPGIEVTVGAEIIFIAYLLIADYTRKKPEVRKPLVYTMRMKRLVASSFVWNVILFLMLGYSFQNKYFIEKDISLIGILGIIYILAPIIVYLSNLSMKPVEKMIAKHYFDMAHEKVRSFPELRIVGITGSYGKTSTKFITGTILASKYETLVTPSSYNTPMGLSKVINNDLDERYEVFVAEMGARKIGEIEEVAELCNPKIGILTSVGPAHLETFGNLENIAKTKYELIESLPADGIAIFNYDNEYTRKLADKTYKEKLTYGIDSDDADLYATDIKVTETGSSFMMADKFGNKVQCHTRLLGKHNILNLLAGACAGLAMGMSLVEIAKGIEKVQPVEHRLQLINSGNGVLVIDDAFNSNPHGARAALEVLDEFTTGSKIIVTPGMIELGEFGEEENRKFGEVIAGVCDTVILVGKNQTKPIQNGLKIANFDEENLYIVNSLSEATEIIGKIVRVGDVVLFENDLPDTFAE